MYVFRKIIAYMQANSLIENKYLLKVEQAVIGQCLLVPKTIATAVEWLGPEDFFLEKHKTIYSNFLGMYSQNKKIDLLTYFYSHPNDDYYYLTGCTGMICNSTHLEEHCAILIQESIRRQIQDITADIQPELYNDSFEIAEELEKRISKMLSKGKKKTLKTIHEILHSSINNLQLLKANKGITGIASGFFKLDAILGGFENGEFIVIAGRPSMGKTSFVLNIINDTLNRGYKPLLFSLEMSANAIMNRFISMNTDIDSLKLRQGKLSDEDFSQIMDTTSKLYMKNLLVDDTDVKNILDLETRIENTISVQPVDYIVIDYLGLISTREKGRSEYDTITENSLRLKKLAKRINKPLICLHQLSRKNEERANKEPVLSDLRSSGAIEQDADVVIFLHDEDYYNKGREKEEVSHVDVIIAKQRNGGIGRQMLHFARRFSKFNNIFGDEPVKAINEQMPF